MLATIFLISLACESVGPNNEVGIEKQSFLKVISDVQLDDCKPFMNHATS